MSKKSKKKPQSAPQTMLAPGRTAEEHASAPQQFRLRELQTLAKQHVNNKAWSELLELSRSPLSAIHEEDRREAEIGLLRARVVGLYPPTTRHIYDLQDDTRAELRLALEQLAQKVETFHALPEFDLYLSMQGWSVEESVAVFKWLTLACMEVSKPDWICQLRARGLHLLSRQAGDYEAPFGESLELLSTLPDITLVLSEAYAVAESSDTLDDYGRALVTVLKHDLNLRVADAWEYGRLGEALRRLPCPDERELASAPSPRTVHKLTPRSWAFMWELEHCSLEGFHELLQTYPEEFASDGCEGLRLALKAILSTPEDADKNLVAATEALMRYTEKGTDWLGDQLTVAISEEVATIDVLRGLRMASVSDLLLRLCELAPRSFQRRDELESLYRILSATMAFSPLEDEENADENMPGLAWLCARNVHFQFAAAANIQGVSGRMRLLLDALCRTIEASGMPPYSYYGGDLTGETLDESGAQPVLDLLRRLAKLRSRMNDASQQMWLAVVEDVFYALSQVGDEVRTHLLKLAREFSDDLAKKDPFRLAYLEQVAGDPDSALRYYLLNIHASEKVPDVSVKNAKLLWARSKDMSHVQCFVDTLQEELTSSNHADAVRQLLADAQERLKVLNKQDQFERTAANRWPSLTAPARKLLGVLAAINRYNGFRELAEYAGMEEVWVRRHYDKLVESGMLLLSDSGYRINPHITPLLERESQHAVIGRIVRTQGTCAVKQVFNSQREFTIYQALVQLCPNHLVFPNCALQSIMSFDRMKELVAEDDFGYYLRASVDIVVVSTTTYLPMLAIEVDSVWHDTERQQTKDDKKDRLFAAAGIPFMRLRPVGNPTESTIRAQVAEHVDELVRSLRTDLPGYDQARRLLEDLSQSRSQSVAS